MRILMHCILNILGCRHNAGGRGGLQLIGLKWRGGSYLWLGEREGRVQLLLSCIGSAVAEQILKALLHQLVGCICLLAWSGSSIAGGNLDPSSSLPHHLPPTVHDSYSHRFILRSCSWKRFVQCALVHWLVCWFVGNQNFPQRAHPSNIYMLLVSSTNKLCLASQDFLEVRYVSEWVTQSFLASQLYWCYSGN